MAPRWTVLGLSGVAVAGRAGGGRLSGPASWARSGSPSAPKAWICCPPMPASALMNVMIAAARKAGRGLTRDFGEVEQLQVSVKGPGNFVTAADHRAEDVLYRGADAGAAGLRFSNGGARRHRRPRQDASLDRRSA